MMQDIKLPHDGGPARSDSTGNLEGYREKIKVQTRKVKKQNRCLFLYTPRCKKEGDCKLPQHNNKNNLIKEKLN